MATESKTSMAHRGDEGGRKQTGTNETETQYLSNNSILAAPFPSPRPVPSRPRRHASFAVL
eukprot:10559396-Prorocentrum_lima.AAC.1